MSRIRAKGGHPVREPRVLCDPLDHLEGPPGPHEVHRKDLPEGATMGFPDEVSQQVHELSFLSMTRPCPGPSAPGAGALGRVGHDGSGE